ncbi:hypothetical protein [Paenibacillus oralis]|uniref:hypothetical protein n=1 Tax=Paenibacillus oralis TaxID=2490856 RepID=UPI001C49B8DE|nr:hypothetical protein [Paenibacillus oralis]
MIGLSIFPRGICQICGCTDTNACVTEAGPCFWVNEEHDLCSTCYSEMSADDVGNLDMNVMINVPLHTFVDFHHFNRFRVPIISITYNTSDFPHKYAGRLFDLDQPTPYIVIRNTLEELRQEIPPHFSVLERSVNDDPVIVEVWV